MAYQKGLELPDGTTYSYHRILRVQLPAFVQGTGLTDNTAHVLVESYASPQAFQAGKMPIQATVRSYYLSSEPFKKLPIFNSNDDFMIWAYKTLQPFLPDLEDAVLVDITPIPGQDNSV